MAKSRNQREGWYSGRLPSVKFGPDGELLSQGRRHTRSKQGILEFRRARVLSILAWHKPATPPESKP